MVTQGEFCPEFNWLAGGTFGKGCPFQDDKDNSNDDSRETQLKQHAQEIHTHNKRILTLRTKNDTTRARRDLGRAEDGDSFLYIQQQQCHNTFHMHVVVRKLVCCVTVTKTIFAVVALVVRRWSVASAKCL